MPEARDSYFETPDRAERMGLIGHVLHNTDLVPCLRGPAGVGKSVFAAQMPLGLSEVETVLVVSAAEQAEIRQAVCEGLGVADGPWPYVVTDAAASESLVLVIDDADQLTEDQCQDLSALNDGGIHLVFVIGDDANPPVGDWRVQLIDLPPLDEAQSRAFLLQVSPEGTQDWREAQWQKVWERSGGLPGALLEMAANGGPPVAVSSSLWKWLLGAAAALLVIGVLWQQERINALFSPPSAVTPEVPQETAVEATPEALPAGVQPLALPPKAETEAPIEMVNESEAVNEPEHVASPEQAVTAPATETSDALDPANAIESAPEETPPVQIDRPAASLPPALPEPTPMDELVPPAPSAVVPEGVAVEPEGMPAPEAPVASRPPPAAKPASPPMPAPAAPTAEAAVKAPTVVRAPVVTQPVAQGVKWLRSRKADHYTLQLLGARDRAAVDKFIRQHRLDGKYAVFTRDLGGKPWYSLVYGDYPNRDAAIRGRAGLPAGLRRDDVWPRTFASVWAQLPP